jgi:hypothetical protein
MVREMVEGVRSCSNHVHNTRGREKKTIHYVSLCLLIKAAYFILPAIYTQHTKTNA